ncbi:MAG: hypothetical protein ABIU58_13530 [Ramlibacter sp.]
MRVAWPAFLAACVLELVVFAVVDPHDLHWAGRQLDWSRQGVYSLAFFMFWAVSAGAGWLTALLGFPPQDTVRESME